MQPTLQFNKTFVRKIVIGQIAYTVEHDGKKGTITIKDSTRNKWLYIYDTKTNKPIYEQQNIEVIKYIFDKVHVERYML